MRNIDITEDMINDLEDQYDADDNFEVVPKGIPGKKESRNDKTRLSKEDRKKTKQIRKQRKEAENLWQVLMTF